MNIRYFGFSGLWSGIARPRLQMEPVVQLRPARNPQLCLNAERAGADLAAPEIEQPAAAIRRAPHRLPVQEIVAGPATRQHRAAAVVRAVPRRENRNSSPRRSALSWSRIVTISAHRPRTHPSGSGNSGARTPACPGCARSRRRSRCSPRRHGWRPRSDRSGCPCAPSPAACAGSPSCCARGQPRSVFGTSHKDPAARSNPALRRLPAPDGRNSSALRTGSCAAGLSAWPISAASLSASAASGPP